MPYNGVGTFVALPPPDYPAVPGELVKASQHNNNMVDLFGGLSNAVTRDGQSPPTANLPMAGKRFTNVGDAVLAQEYLTKGQTASTVTGEVSVGYLPAGTGAVGSTVQDKLRELSISVTDFGAVGDGVTDDAAAILLAKAHAIANLPCRLIFPKGTYKIDSSTGNWAYKGLTLEGVGSRGSILKFTYAGQAFLIDAFQPGFTANDATAPYVYRMNLQGLVFEGNSATTDIIFARGIAQSMWTDVLVREANATTGVGFNLQGMQLNTFIQVSCTVNQDTMTSVPNNGLRIGAGTRNGISVGNSTDNSFINCYAEGNAIGWWLTGSDMNIFLSGAPEGCTQYGCIISGTSKMNTFIGVGFENPAATTAGCADGGLSNKFINCYNSTLHDCQGKKGEINGGYYEKINVNGAALAAFNHIHDCVINHWATGSGGFTDTGTGTQWARIYDDDTAAEIYPFKTRSSITVTASPFQYANTTGRVVEVVMQTGTITQVRKIRGADSWLQPTAIPGNHLLLPGDTLEVSYSVAPGMSLVQHNSAS